MAAKVTSPVRGPGWLEDLQENHPELYAEYQRKLPQVIDSKKDYTDGKQRRKFPGQPRDPLGGP